MGDAGEHAANLVSRLGQAPLIGREREIASLGLLFVGKHPTTRVILLRGESGIGKSRLLREAQALATTAGWCILSGAADMSIGLVAGITSTGFGLVPVNTS